MNFTLGLFRTKHTTNGAQRKEGAAVIKTRVVRKSMLSPSTVASVQRDYEYAYAVQVDCILLSEE